MVYDKKIANPFTEIDQDLITLDTEEIVDPLIANCMRDVEEYSEAMAKSYIEERIEKGEKPI